jgi:serine phosphatase RsbU (regulator of sigma subunit)
LHHDYEEAYRNAEKGEKYLDAVSGSLLVPLFIFYQSLARLAVFHKLSRNKQIFLLSEISRNQKKMKKWADQAPMNQLHKFYLVEAEISRVKRKEGEAMDFYEKAIKGACENDYIQEEALANKLAALYYKKSGRQRVATIYMKHARYLYEKWGAKAIIDLLDEKYSDLLIHVARRKEPSRTRAKGISLKRTTTIENTGKALDLTTVLKASQTISGEIVLAKLLENLMRIAMENAGAEKGYLLLVKHDKLLIEAEGSVNKARVEVLQSSSYENRNDLACSVIKYVARMMETVVLNDAANEDRFTRDVYISLNEPKSILCMPIINQKKLSGILYLENSLTAGAFTPDRLEVLGMLSSQAGISIENAGLYASLEEKVKERTKDLNYAMKKLQERDEVIENELLMASNIQKGILPQKQLKWEDISIVSNYEPMDHIGGDFFDIMEMQNGLAVYVADVSGHGIPASLVASLAKISFIKAGSYLKSPKGILGKVNEELGNLIKTDEYLTCFFLLFKKNSQLVYGNAGHLPALLYKKNTDKIISLDTPGFFIGAMPIPDYDYVEKKNVFKPGDRIILVTDGIIEGRNIQGEEFGIERLKEGIIQYKDNQLTEFKDMLLKDYKDFTKGTKSSDDITIIVIEKFNKKTT